MFIWCLGKSIIFAKNKVSRKLTKVVRPVDDQGWNGGWDGQIGILQLVGAATFWHHCCLRQTGQENSFQYQHAILWHYPHAKITQKSNNTPSKYTSVLSWMTLVSWRSGSVLNFTGGLSVPSDDTTDLWGLDRRVLWNTSDQSQVARGEQLRLFS